MQRARGNLSSYFRILNGAYIPITLYGKLRRSNRAIFIVTPFLEDYEFFGKSPLSKLLLRQKTEGVNITMLTLPPEGTNGTRKAFSRKYNLMNTLHTQGVEVLFNTKLHAKVFLFDESEVTKACILGSANLTKPAMDERLEIAVLSHNRDFYQKVLSVVMNFKHDNITKNFLKWKYENAAIIKERMGG